MRKPQESGVAELARAKWRSSGLTDPQAKDMKLQAKTAEQVVQLHGSFAPAGALYIPYFDLRGKLTKFYRIRYLEKLPGFAGALEKPQRYAQPPGTLNEVYLPPLLGQTWEEIVADAEIPLYITEGELKAAAGCVAGLATIGLGGVDVWRSSKRGMEFLPTLAAIQWENREVTIVYDSDAATNANVVRAQGQLAREFLNRGALPRIASLPPSKDGQKQGLDDFLVRSSPAALVTLLDEAPNFPEADALWQMNSEVAYVKDPGLVVVRDSGQRLSPNSFEKHAFSHRHYLETKTTKKGVTTEKKSLAERWIKWERRFELERITYLPGQTQITTDKEWNTWPGWGVQPEKGDVNPWRELLNFVFRNESAETLQWFERWCAYPIQHPGTKMFTSAVLWGVVHGTGKTLVGHTLMKIYGKNASEVGDDDLEASFNDWAKDKQFVMGDEVTGKDHRAAANRLKGMITRLLIRINEKHIPKYVVPDCVNYFWTSNEPDAFFLADHDRRFFVHEVVGEPASIEFYTMYDRWLHGRGPAHLFHHLLHVDLGDFNPKAPALVTNSKKAMIVDNKSDLGAWVVRLREEPSSALRALGESVSNNAELLSPSQLLRAYDPEGQGKVTVNGLSRELKRSGFRQVNKGTPIKVCEPYELQRLYAVRNLDKWAKTSPKDCAKHFNEVFGKRKY